MKKESYRNWQSSMHIKICIILFLLLNITLSGCYQYSPVQSISTNTPDPKRSGYVLLDYAEQYRNISSIMMRRNLEKDYDSIENLLSEGMNIASNVEALEVTPQYSTAKELLSNWISHDSFHYSLILEDGSKEFIRISAEKSLDYFTQFLEEMIRLGHDLD